MALCILWCEHCIGIQAHAHTNWAKQVERWQGWFWKTPGFELRNHRVWLVKVFIYIYISCIGLKESFIVLILGLQALSRFKFIIWAKRDPLTMYIYILKTGSEWFGFVFGPDGMSTRAPHALVPKVNAAFCDFWHTCATFSWCVPTCHQNHVFLCFPLRFMFKVLRNRLLPYIFYTCPNYLW